MCPFGVGSGCFRNVSGGADINACYYATWDNLNLKYSVVCYY